TGYTGSNIDNLILKKNWQYSYNFQGSGIESGTDISRDEFNSLWNKHIPYEELDASFIEYLEKDDIPYLDLDNVPLMNSASFEADKSPVIKNALIEGIHYGDRAYAYLAGENIFKLAEDGSDYIRMDRMFVVFYRQNLPNVYVYLDPISVDSTDGSHGNIVTRTYKYQQNYTFELYRLDDTDILVIGNNEYIRSDGANCNFVAMTRDGRFILLKGTDINGNTVSPRISTSNKLEVSGNSLYDPANGVNFTFFPEMFDYADPDTEHAHFTCAAYAPEVSVRGGFVYSSAYDSDSIPKKEVYENVAGTQEDLDRWNSYISSVEPAVIHAADRGKYTHALPDSEAEKLLNMVRSVELGLMDDVRDDDWEWDIIGCDSEGGVLFTAHYNGVWLKVTFDDSGKSYTFVSDTSMKAIISILE
ncbi:MAG: hypothetical protein K2N56_12075, partial [Oscillospiraceae bacterium]|nr:hypothetical protein [Oscillospiraceae bacterium]